MIFIIYFFLLLLLKNVERFMIEAFEPILADEVLWQMKGNFRLPALIDLFTSDTKEIYIHIYIYMIFKLPAKFEIKIHETNLLINSVATPSVLCVILCNSAVGP